MIPKFRAWDKYTNDMVKIKTIDLETDGSIGCVVDYSDIYLDVSECVLMQSTGLKDKNGVEIYEGDVVTDEFTAYIVRWCSHNGRILLKPINDVGTFPAKHIKYTTLMGNIHENPELLVEEE